MRGIVKSAPPTSLSQHRRKLYSDYDNYPDKGALRDALVSEQRGLCCYCMARIRRGEARVEHWRCQSRYPREQLNYQKLLAACSGGEDRARRFQHCDTYKGDRDLRWNPADPTHSIEARIRYEADGAIRSNDAGFDAELRQVLNLNLPMLKNSRQGVLNEVLEWWRREKARVKGRVPRSRLERERNRLTPETGEFQPYRQVAVWWLDQRLKRTA